MKTLTGRAGKAFSIPLPAVADRPNKDTIASLSRWQLLIPGSHPLWNRYVLMACSLADFPGVPPAKKQFPEATHEITVFAVPNDFPQKAWEEGGIQVLEPVNHVWQCCTTDAIAEELMEFLAQELIDGRQFVEPSGISGARELFSDSCLHWLAGRSARENDPKPTMKEPWIQTYTGKQFSYLEASADQISIDDIARALSHLCRFTGHCKSFYSVAQHSVLVSWKTKNQFFGLMHDADEAYTGDMNRPLKHFLGAGSFFERAANTAWYAIRDKFPRLKEVTPEEEADCKKVDLRMLVTESHELLLNGPHPDWQINQSTHPRYEGDITPWTPDYAMTRFLDRFNELNAT